MKRKASLDEAEPQMTLAVDLAIACWPVNQLSDSALAATLKRLTVRERRWVRQAIVRVGKALPKAS